MVLPGQDIFAIFDHLDFLLAGPSEVLGLLDLLVSGPVLNVSDLFFEVEFVIDEDVIELFVLHLEVLSRI